MYQSECSATITALTVRTAALERRTRAALQSGAVVLGASASEVSRQAGWEEGADEEEEEWEEEGQGGYCVPSYSDLQRKQIPTVGL